MTLYVRKHVVAAGIKTDVLREIVDKAVILVEGETVDKEIISLDNYYYWGSEKTIEDYLTELISMSHGHRARKIYALLVGEKHVLSIEVEDGKIRLLDMGEKIH